jgi:hypothetical protein
MSDELKQKSIDTPEFSRLLGNLIEVVMGTEKEVIYGSCRAALVAHIDAWGARMAVPAGWKLVPIEPTDVMVAHGMDPGCASAYRRMVGAAPSPTKEQSCG